MRKREEKQYIFLFFLAVKKIIFDLFKIVKEAFTILSTTINAGM